MISKYAEIFCWKNVSSFCNAKATHIFSAKYFRILYIGSAKTVNGMTLNKLVKLTMLWTTGPWTQTQNLVILSSRFQIIHQWKERHWRRYTITKHVFRVCVDSEDPVQPTYLLSYLFCYQFKLDTLDRISAILYKRDNFCDFLFSFLHNKCLRKGVFSKRKKKFPPKGVATSEANGWISVFKMAAVWPM